ncbi:UNVERIFIED_CONTAM: hypothetical protein Sangu_2662400 [Sesamum angustifolium]|uniref:Uncharacterized protein n=1 Tax=Sesamum angustifolium TaxID=2727405 RepID=A0AAW2J3Q1_9LAMI
MRHLPYLFLGRKSTSQTFSCNPSGDFDASNLPRGKDHYESFTILQIPADIQDETYVAAFLSCWLCSFVLPHRKAGKVRASTFKVASRMAQGGCFSLAVPLWQVSTVALVTCLLPRTCSTLQPFFPSMMCMVGLDAIFRPTFLPSLNLSKLMVKYTRGEHGQAF